ncbi:MAG: DUF924 domain-containing protein [Acidobacteria bacterium]|nr:DUF924 domain-containing protein [Acidobacteriota bacterium]MCB9399482.1 DUF924 domain-containing protein [Acidobacteriota bacterium]
MNPIEVLTFWFGAPWDQDPIPKDISARWFKKSNTFDREIHNRFHSLWLQFQSGIPAHWLDSPPARLAAVLVCDQFPRNMFRDSAAMYQSDDLALSLARMAVAQNDHLVLPATQAVFLLLPFEHSESLEDQEQCLALFDALIQTHGASATLQNYRTYAVKHRDIIAEFGRFPHRNSLLGRPNQPNEVLFLQKPGSRF